MEHKNNSQVDQKKAEKKATVRYKECLKNHAASLGGNATDGCGEFMASGEDDSLKCSACNCHRNFHRKENLDSEHYVLSVIPEPLLAHLSPNHKSGSISPSDNSDDQNIKCEEYGSRKVKKRFRTKFTQEQKEKMLCFAEKAGWKIQKLDESMVQRFCQEVGIKRRVLKVWMHNNKNTFANKNNLSN